MVRLFEYTGLFLNAAVYVGPSVGLLLRELFSGGPSISLKINEEHIQHMMNLVFMQGRSGTLSLGTEGRAAMMLALQELVKVYY